MSLDTQLKESLSYLQRVLAGRPIDGFIILGSGLGEFAETLEISVRIPYAEIPHFQTSKVEGHSGTLVVGQTREGLTLACMQGRYHYYEGHDLNTVVYPVRVLKQLGARFMIVTNAAGGIRGDLTPGTLMLIEDHINMTGQNPLRGENNADLGPRFVDMTEAYDKRLQTLAKSIAKQLDFTLPSGVYLGLTGPTYETPAEVRMLQILGGDAVGMSTVPEVIVANHMSLPVLGISCITNQAAGLSDNKLNHQEVMDTAQSVKVRFIQLLNGVLSGIARNNPLDLAQPQAALHE